MAFYISTGFIAEAHLLDRASLETKALLFAVVSFNHSSAAKFESWLFTLLKPAMAVCARPSAKGNYIEIIWLKILKSTNPLCVKKVFLGALHLQNTN